MLNKVEKTTIKGVINWYSSQTIPNYTIIHKSGKTAKYSYSGGDFEEGLNTLSNQLSDLVGDEGHCNTYDYFLRLDDNSKVKNKEERSILFNLTGEHKNNTVSGIPMMYASNSSNLSESRIAEIIRKELEERDRQFEADEIEEEIEEAKPEGVIGMLNQMLSSNPELQTTIATGLIAGINHLCKSFMPKSTTVTHVAGVDEKVNINDVLKELYSKGVTNTDLYNLSKKDQSTITMLLSMLRNK